MDMMPNATWSAKGRGNSVSLDVSLMVVQPVEVFTANITHNLGAMAKEAGIYQHLWRPGELSITKASQLIGPLQTGLAKLLADPKRFKELNPETGWGNYDGLVRFTTDYLAACEKNPEAEVIACR